MQVKPEELREMAKDLLAVLEGNGINSNRELRKHLGTELRCRQLLNAVMLQNRPSNLGTAAPTISYVTPDGCIPIELRINEKLNYSTVIAKCTERIRGYGLPPYILPQQDEWGNFYNYKILKTRNFSLVIAEVRHLAV